MRFGIFPEECSFLESKKLEDEVNSALNFKDIAKTVKDYIYRQKHITVRDLLSTKSNCESRS